MINEVSFKNFRGLRALKLYDLAPITLISGKNNAGKSSILEGIFLLFDHQTPESFHKINNFRGLSILSNPNSAWEAIFYNLDMTSCVNISVRTDEQYYTLKYERDTSYIPNEGLNAPQDVINQMVTSAKTSSTLRFHFEDDQGYREKGHFVFSPTSMMRNIDTSEPQNIMRPMPFVQYINSAIIQNEGQITDWFGNLELQGKKSKIIDILKIIEPGISDVLTIALRGQPQLYARVNDQLLPLKLTGDGVNKLLFMILAIIQNPNSLILIDEIETGFHYSMYQKLWSVIATAAKENNCQIIATTHSYECINGVVEGINRKSLEDDFCFYRIEHKDNENKAFRYSGALLYSAVNTNMEVR